MSDSETREPITNNEEEGTKNEETLEEINDENNECLDRPSPLIPKELVFDSKLIQYISEYRDEIKMRSRDDLLECEVKSLEVLMNDQGFQYVTRKMMGKEHLEEAFFIEFLESYCSDYYNFLNGGEELKDEENTEEETSSPKQVLESNVVIEELIDQ